MKKFLKVIALVLTLSICLSGCGTKRQVNVNNGELEPAKLGDSYPLECEDTLDVWADASVYAEYTSYKDQPFYNDLLKNTGVNAEFRFPPQGQSSEAFNLLIASGDMPDVIIYQWLWVPGGPQKFIDEGYIRPLNDVFEKYTPNISKYLSENSDIDRMIKTDEHQYYCFPFVRGDEWLTTYMGPVVRSDLLKKYNVEVPVTIDDWTNMLTVFKENGVKSPLALISDRHYLASGTNGYFDFYIDEGKVKYGPIENGWKDYINVMNKWYNSGLIDKDYGSIDSTIMNQKVAQGDVGATIGSGSNIGTWLSSGKKQNESFDLIGISYPVPEEGMIAKFGQKDNLYNGVGCAAITQNCKNVELAAKFLDYFYTEEGRMLSNFGTEGVSYEMVNDEPKFTDAVFDESGSASYIGKYAWSHSTVLSIQDRRMYEQRLAYPQQKTAIDVWQNTNMAEHRMPVILPNSEESSMEADISNQIDTYMEEFFFESVSAPQPLTDEAFAAYVEQMKALGIDQLIEIYNTCVERYNKR